MSSYQPGIPTGTVNLDVDYLNIQNNFQQLDTSFGVDHVPFSNQTAQNGYHTSIHFNPVSTTVTNPPNNQPPVVPAAVPGFGQLFSCQINDGLATDEALFFETGGARLIQLTRNLQPLDGTKGYTCLPGGFILQWGFLNGTHGSDNHFSSGDDGTINFGTAPNIAFPNNCFLIWTQPMYTTGSEPSGAATVAIDRSFTKALFNWTFTTNSSAYTRFLWIALGN